MEAPSFAPAAVVAESGARVGCLDETLWAARTPDELVATVTELESLRSRLASVEASVLVEVEARKIAKTHLGWGSTSDWFTHLTGAHHGQGRRTVRTPPSSPPSCPRR